MCGIVGYTGKNEALPILIEGLKRLEYRGYDSAGIAIANNHLKIERKRCQGKLSNLQNILKNEPLYGNTAIGHTRWATHGVPSDKNAHPHTDCTETIGVVHNGIIENYSALKEELIHEGHIFTSETDTEVIAHLIEKEHKNSKDFADAVFRAVARLRGSFALGITYSKNPQELIAVKKESPLVLGINEEGSFIASDVPALLPFTKSIIYLEDGDVVFMQKNELKIYDSTRQEVKRKICAVSWSPLLAEKQGFKHFMLKEIYEQKRALQETLMGRLSRNSPDVNFENINIDLKNISRVSILACGTAYHAGLTGKFLFESYLKISCEVNIASEFRYGEPVINNSTLAIAISQSGETADTIAAMKEAKNKGAKIILICNVVGSTATRIADGVIYTHAGPEIGVASTKAFTTQLAAIYLLILYLGKIKNWLITSCTSLIR
jgi:glucosamine--fructose-6-phosphate aminotransferase (isomerizing)